MLQCIKRAYKLDRNNPKLHSCLIRFYEFVNQSKDSWDSAVEEVVKNEVKCLFNDKEAKQLNKDYLETFSNSLESILEGAKMLYHLDNKEQARALSLVTNLDNKYKDVNIKVSTRCFIKTCIICYSTIALFFVYAHHSLRIFTALTEKLQQICNKAISQLFLVAKGKICPEIITFRIFFLWNYWTNYR